MAEVQRNDDYNVFSPYEQDFQNGNEEQVQEPPMYKVVFFNDDYTTKDFVVDVLVSIFHKNEIDANSLMEKVHIEGYATVGIYPYDIAVTRTEITTSRARANGFPLLVKVTSED